MWAQKGRSLFNQFWEMEESEKRMEAMKGVTKGKELCQ